MDEEKMIDLLHSALFALVEGSFADGSLDISVYTSLSDSFYDSVDNSLQFLLRDSTNLLFYRALSASICVSLEQGGN